MDLKLVQLHGLKTEAYNGLLGIDFNKIENGRRAIQLEDKRQILFKPENIGFIVPEEISIDAIKSKLHTWITGAIEGRKSVIYVGEEHNMQGSAASDKLTSIGKIQTILAYILNEIHARKRVGILFEFDTITMEYALPLLVYHEQNKRMISAYTVSYINTLPEDIRPTIIPSAITPDMRTNHRIAHRQYEKEATDLFESYDIVIAILGVAHVASIINTPKNPEINCMFLNLLTPVATVNILFSTLLKNNSSLDEIGDITERIHSSFPILKDLHEKSRSIFPPFNDPEALEIGRAAVDKMPVKAQNQEYKRLLGSYIEIMGPKMSSAAGQSIKPIKGGRRKVSRSARRKNNRRRSRSYKLRTTR